MECKYCESEMRLVDNNTLGFITIRYWACDNCGASANEEIRNGVYNKLTFKIPENLTLEEVRERMIVNLFRDFGGGTKSL